MIDIAFGGVDTQTTIQPDKLEAFIFDLDGVLTDTASLHYAAWKRTFDEFLEKRPRREGAPYLPFKRSDYLDYVDGKPRYDGVKDFLASRHISIPWGNEHEGPTGETVCGLGNRKDRYYLSLLRKKGPKLYPTSVEFIRSVRDHGLKTAIISSSRNCSLILRMTGTRRLFDAKVDGLDSEKLGIPGKPNPAIFLEAARRIEARPRDAAIVEDAISGVEAGRRGRFGLVVGVARSHDGRQLRRHGADIAVSDLGELRLDGGAEGGDASRWTTMSALANKRLESRIRSRRLAAFLDYDGTLAEIVEDPSEAFITRETRDLLRILSRLCPVAILSGRDVQVVKKFVGLKGVTYAGSHGFDILMADGKRVDDPRWRSYLEPLSEADRELRETMRGIRGVIVERKRFAISVHYRMVRPDRVAEVRRRFDRAATSFLPELRRSGGKKVLEVMPNTDWNKGKALLFLLKSLRLDRRDVLPLFMGDDVTDEDAFRVLRKRGVGILVAEHDRKTLARYHVRNPTEVRLLLRELIAILEAKEP
jgi:trehalose-phosphatase